MANRFERNPAAKKICPITALSLDMHTGVVIGLKQKVHWRISQRRLQ